MSAPSRFSAAAGTVSVFVGRCCGVFYLAAIALSLWEVFCRYALDAPTAWAAESVMTLCASAWLLSAAAVARQRRHIVVSAMELLVGRRAWRRLEKVALLLGMLAVAGLLVACWEPMLSSLRSAQRSGSAFNPPTPTYFKTLIVGGCALYLLQLFANFADSFGGRTADGETGGKEEKGIPDGD